MRTPAGAALQLVPLVGLLVVGLVIWSRVRPGAGGGSVLLELGATVGREAVGAASTVAGGIVQGVGEAIGIPRTNETECAAAIREGRMWDASFACPAADFIGAAWRTVADGTTRTAPPPTREGGATGSW